MKTRNSSILSILAVAALALPASLMASTSNPPDLYVLHGEATAKAVSCTACHANGASGNGSLTLEGLPAKFEAGKTYSLTVKLSHGGAKKAGFRLAAQTPTGAQAGKIINRDPSMDVHVAQTVTFLKQSYNGTVTNGADRSWTFQWKAPETGSAVFSVEGVAGNGDGSVREDHTYTFSASTEAGAPTKGLAD